VLVHEVRGSAAQWDPFVPYLHDAGFATLAYDGRGGYDEKELVKEVSGAVDFLRRRPDVDARRLGIVGASIGASTTALAVAREERRTLRAAVALSPPDTPALDPLQTAGRYRPRNVLFVADERESSSLEYFMDGAVSSRTLVSPVPGHGVLLLREDPIRRAVLDWLEERVCRPSGCGNGGP
jgi:pimeloyl-ACP methyl ester carboxylesterase